MSEVPTRPWLGMRPVNVVPHPPFPSTLKVSPTTLREVAQAGDVALQALDKEVGSPFRRFLEGAHVAFILAGLGGDTGSWAAAVACRVAKAMGLLTLPVVTLPFRVEGEVRGGITREVLSILLEEGDLTMTFANDHLLKLVPNVPIAKAFRVMARIVAITIDALGQALSHADVHLLGDFLRPCREARVGLGVGRGEHATFRAVEEVFQSPWFDFPLEASPKGLLVLEGVEPHSRDQVDVEKYISLRAPKADLLSTCIKGRSLEVRLTLILGLPAGLSP